MCKKDLLNKKKNISDEKVKKYEHVLIYAYLLFLEETTISKGK